MDVVTMPPAVGIRFAHASLEVMARDHGIDLLHIKGPAVDPRLRDAGRESIDADVLVRPAHVDRLIAVMHRHGWSTQWRFEDGSAFEHASTLVHAVLAPVDVHRRFPGLDGGAEEAFARLWADRGTAVIAGVPCAVPSVDGQRLILIVHAARTGVPGHSDLRRCWVEATPEEQQRVIELAADVGAEVALAAGSGRLDEFVGHRTHALWKALSTGERSEARIWAARVRAAPTVRAAVRTAVRLVVPNRHRMERRLGRPPSSGELVKAYLLRSRRGARELLTVVRAAVRERSGR